VSVSTPADRSGPGRVLVTGASGFVGQHLCRRFAALGWSVTGIGRRPLDVPGYVRHDLATPLPLETLGPFDVVVHAAARASPWGSRRQFEADNVVATRLLLDACVRHGLPRFVFVSSSSVYYRAEHQLGITEKTPFADPAINRYAESKQRGERLVRDYPGRWAILRPRAVFGPGDTVLLPRVLRAARAGRLPLLEAPDGPVVGDLIYIDNLVDAIIRAAADPAIDGDVNLTNDEPVPILAFLLDILDRLGIPAPRKRVSVRMAMRMAGLIETLWFLPGIEPPITRFGVHVFAYSKTFDVSKMRAHFGPPRISIAEGVARTVASVKEAERSATSG
jgi:2-alkyl-3-oxoalkanoate reductase